jgi:hypothetical protein
LKRLGRLLGLADRPYPVDTEFDAVYGLPLRAFEKWLTRNPRLGKPCEVRLAGVKPADVLASTMATHTRKGRCPLNYLDRTGEPLSPPEPLALFSGQPEEVLIPDLRAGLRPADVLERRLLDLLWGASVVRRPLRMDALRPGAHNRPGTRAGEFFRR